MPANLTAAAQRVLDAIVAAAAAHDPVVTLPSRQFKHLGRSAHDCEQVTVDFTGAGTGVPGRASGPTRCAAPTTITVRASIVRCQPIPDAHGNPPAPELLDAAAEAGAVDATLLLAAVRAADTQGQGTVHSIDAIDPAGGLGGVTLTATIAAL